MTRWGWRIPPLVGCAIVPLLFLLRRSLRETDEFLAQRRYQTVGDSLASLARNWQTILAGMMMVTLTTVLFYFITAYTPTFGSAVLHLSTRDSLIVTLCVGASNFVLLPLFGSLSDRIGRRPLLVGFTSLALLSVYPAMQWLVSAPSFGRLLAVEIGLSVLFAGYNGAMVVYLTEIVPRHLRTTGFSMSYSLATAVFGGFTPAICTYLIHATANRAAPGGWVSAAALIGLSGVLWSSLLQKDRTSTPG
jgi:MFS family permease